MAFIFPSSDLDSNKISSSLQTILNTSLKFTNSSINDLNFFDSISISTSYSWSGILNTSTSMSINGISKNLLNSPFSSLLKFIFKVSSYSLLIIMVCLSEHICNILLKIGKNIPYVLFSDTSHTSNQFFLRNNS